MGDNTAVKNLSFQRANKVEADYEQSRHELTSFTVTWIDGVDFTDTLARLFQYRLSSSK